MKAYFTRTAHLIYVALIILATACKDDDPVVKPVVSFAAATKTVSEGDGVIEALVQLDRPAPSDLTVRYKLTGTAVEGTSSSADYKVVGRFGELLIPQGASSATIQFDIRQDGAVEGNETIIVTLDNILNDAGTLGAIKEMIITIEDDDLGAKVSFASATRTVTESDRAIEIELVLDIPASQNLTVNYAFTYTGLPQNVTPAFDSLYLYNEVVAAGEDPAGYRRFYDFYVDGQYGVITIPSGQSSGKIKLNLYSDLNLENDEIIEITITSVSTGGQIGNVPKTTVTLKQEDGMLFGLFWDPYPNVDMDLFLWIGEDSNELDLFTLSANGGVTPQRELIFLPKVLLTEIGNAKFGLSYVYYSGTQTPMEFEVQFIEFINGALEPLANRNIFEATYTLANLNRWDEETGTDPIVVQTFDLVNGAFTNISQITVPDARSRIKSYPIPSGTKRMKPFKGSTFRSFSR